MRRKFGNERAIRWKHGRATSRIAQTADRKIMSVSTSIVSGIRFLIGIGELDVEGGEPSNRGQASSACKKSRLNFAMPPTPP